MCVLFLFYFHKVKLVDCLRECKHIIEPQIFFFLVCSLFFTKFHNLNNFNNIICIPNRGTYNNFNNFNLVSISRLLGSC
jgi:hypothetical protein